jgi:hypothetical protein
MLGNRVRIRVLARIDPTTNSIRQRIRVASGSQNPVYAEGTVWITSSALNLLTAVDAQSGRKIATLSIASQPHFLTAGDGGVWTLDQGSGSITKVDAQSKRVVATIHAKIPGSGGTVALGAGFTWATVYGTPLTKIAAAYCLQQSLAKPGTVTHEGRRGHSIRIPIRRPHLGSVRALRSRAGRCSVAVRSAHRRRRHAVHRAGPRPGL